MHSYLHQFVQHHGIKTRKVLDIVSLHHRAVLPDMSSELLHVEDQLCYVSVTHIQTHYQTRARSKPPISQSCKDHSSICVTMHLSLCLHISVNVYVCLLVYEVICALLLDVVCVSKQPDDLVAGK